MQNWPSNQKQWDALAARLQAARVADAVSQWRRDEPEPLSPEEEEMLF
jgi:hypothetical protein